MSNLSLQTRRRNVRGISKRVQPAWARRNFWGRTNRATVDIGTGNAKLTYTAKALGTPGNAITVAYVVAGASTPLSVSVAGSAITVNVATNGSSAAISTAREVRRAVNFNVAANALVHVQMGPASDETGVVSAVGATNLAGATATPIV